MIKSGSTPAASFWEAVVTLTSPILRKYGSMVWGSIAGDSEILTLGKAVLEGVAISSTLRDLRSKLAKSPAVVALAELVGRSALSNPRVEIDMEGFL
jgi:hypothetical protein